MKIEVGKRYRTRDGKQIVFIKQEEPASLFPMRGHLGENAHGWHRHGSWLSEGISPLDLIEEIPAPETERAAPAQPEPEHTVYQNRPAETTAQPAGSLENKQAADRVWTGQGAVFMASDEPTGASRIPLSKADILNEAILTVGGRGKSYGRPEDNFGRIALLWTAHLKNRYGIDLTIDPQDVSMMMVLMKVARLQNDPKHHDSWVDVCGYGACGGELADITPRT